MPTSGHPITLESAKQRWRVYCNNHVIADTDDALILHEAQLAPVVYFPRQDVAMEYMGRTTHHTRCPHKGEASYYTLSLGGEILENVAWSYEEPLDAVGPIASRIAFYADRVEVYPVDDARVNPRHGEREDAQARDEVDAVVQHTDAGDGASQGERWPSNVIEPEGREGGVR